MSQSHHDGMDLLRMSRGDVQASSHFQTPSHVDKVTVGAAIVRTNNKGHIQILLLKRAAHETYYPGVFEIPGGKVDDSDATVYDGLVRQVAEETGLTISRVLRPLEPFTYITEKQSREGLSVQLVRRVTLQLSYIVEVQGSGEDFIVNPMNTQKVPGQLLRTYPPYT